MGYFKVHRVNEGMQIRGENVSIDIIVRSITGRGANKRTYLEVRDGQSVREIHLKYSDGLVQIADFVMVGITDRIESYQNKVPLHYRVPSAYSLNSRTYEPKPVDSLRYSRNP